MTDDNLFRAVDEILYYIWDPIGVSISGAPPHVRDEYTSYVPKVLGLLQSNESAEIIADFLGDIEEKQIGLTNNKNKNIEVAELLLDWRIFLSER